MKCPQCGGEVSYQDRYCPYCGKANLEWFDFQKEIQKKIDRNKLLKPFLIKQKTPELVQKMLTRILFIFIGINVLLLAFSFALFLWEDREIVRSAAQGSQAQRYEQIFRENQEYYYDDFVQEINEFVDRVENGEIPEPEDIVYLLNRTYNALKYTQDEEVIRQETRLIVRAFYMGYLGLTEEDMAYLLPNEEGKYDGYPDEEKAMPMALAIEKRLQEVVK